MMAAQAIRTTHTVAHIQTVLDEAVQLALENHEGQVASYIPELATMPTDLTGVALMLNDGTLLTAGNADTTAFTLQSCAKLTVLIGLLEEVGAKNVFSWVRTEASGDDFASVARLDLFGPLPSNPMLNSGAIALCSHISGEAEERVAWLERWMEKLFGTRLSINLKVFSSERRTGDRNRSLAYLMKSNQVLEGDVTSALETYFYTCSFESTVKQAVYLPMLLANGGCNPAGERVISLKTVEQTVAIMASCGMYNESALHLSKTGMPAKSAVSGCILASGLRHGGIAMISPRVNRRGTSVRGSIMMEHISERLGWHFAR